MAVRIRLQRHGAVHNPVYRLVAADSKARRDGRFIEILGTYAPKAKRPDEELKLKLDRAEYWLSVGALPSDTARSLIKRARRSTGPTDQATTAATPAPKAKAEPAPALEPTPAPAAAETSNLAEMADAGQPPATPADSAPGEDTDKS